MGALTPASGLPTNRLSGRSGDPLSKLWVFATASRTKPAYVVDQWYAVIGPKGINPALVQRLSSDFREAMRSPDVMATLTRSGISAVGSTPEAAAQHIAAEIAKWRKLVSAGGLSLR